MEDWERSGFDELRDQHEVTLVGEPLSAKNAAHRRDAEVVSGFITSEIGESAIEQLENLRMIATRSTGFDHIALDACRRR